MNERIRELAEQAGLEYDFNPMLWLKYEKFAELIVKECIQVVDGMADPEEDSDRYVWALHNAIEKIREHFGVL
jgi:hypothetical protein